MRALRWLLLLPAAPWLLAAPRPRRPARIGGRMTAAQRDAVLREHTRTRAAVRLPPLTWSASLADYAQAWADHLAANACDLRHRADEGRRDGKLYGENLAAKGQNGGPFVWNPAEGVRGWAAEKKDYRGGRYRESMNAVGHYTQMIWRDTKQVGCGMATCKKDGWDWWILACNYDPPGNYIGRKPY